ncbi:MAG TPA: hypothetical protein VKR05_03725 [Candidatus Cybelea sp.]|nr:hypothetical protein [Candidatus Cybelea sp.]
MHRLLVAVALAISALGGWLPRVGQGFDPQSHGQASWAPKYDYFICSRTPIPSTTPFANFDYAVRGCPNLLEANSFAYGSTEPIRGRVLYDPTHKLVLYQEGCCAWRSAVLASGIAPPPKKVGSADLSAVRTQRGVSLGMTPAQIVAIYGKAKPHGVPGTSGITMLSYTTMHGSPSSVTNACGQFQNFAFRNNKLYYIELLAGC